MLEESIELTRCRICKNTHLEDIIDLGDQCLTGVFPKEPKQNVPRSPLRLVKCSEDVQGACGLVQLKHSYNPSAMFGIGYGYRSGLNVQMVNHLEEKVSDLLQLANLKSGDLVIDVGSNDGTLLKMFPSKKSLKLVGIDPSGSNFQRFYPSHITLINDFFSANLIKDQVGNKRAKIITSIAMFYDLESPMSFATEVEEVLADDGIWHLEQSYMPTMLKNLSYDTVCHEHLEYYRLKQIKWMIDATGLKILDIGFNAVNGGSFWITAAKKSSHYVECDTKIAHILGSEERLGLNKFRPYQEFSDNVLKHRESLVELVHKVERSGKKIFGLGASTKGNVILQFCGFSPKDIPFIADVNSEKFGCFTPGTLIPIISEETAIHMHPDYFLVLPWHFRDFFLRNQIKYSHSKLVFPLPSIETV